MFTYFHAFLLYGKILLYMSMKKSHLKKLTAIIFFLSRTPWWQLAHPYDITPNNHFWFQLAPLFFYMRVFLQTEAKSYRISPSLTKKTEYELKNATTC